jgi:hypothetical protein
MEATPHPKIGRSARDPLRLHGEIDSLSRRRSVDDPHTIDQNGAGGVQRLGPIFVPRSKPIVFVGHRQQMGAHVRVVRGPGLLAQLTCLGEIVYLARRPSPIRRNDLSRPAGRSSASLTKPTLGRPTLGSPLDPIEIDIDETSGWGQMSVPVAGYWIIVSTGSSLSPGSRCPEDAQGASGRFCAALD